MVELKESAHVIVNGEAKFATEGQILMTNSRQCGQRSSSLLQRANWCPLCWWNGAGTPLFIVEESPEASPMDSAARRPQPAVRGFAAEGAAAPFTV